MVIYPSAHLSQTPIVQFVCEGISKQFDGLLLCLQSDQLGKTELSQMKVESVIVKTERSEGRVAISPTFLFAVFKEFIRHKPDAVIYVGEKALHFALLLKLFCKCNIYLNLELKFPEDFRSKIRFFFVNRFMRQACNAFDLVITQDRGRARLAKALLKTKKTPFCLIPNIREIARSRTFGARLLSTNKAGSERQPSMIYAGSMHARWAGVSLVEAISKTESIYGRKWKITVHSRLAESDTADGGSHTLASENYVQLLLKHDVGFAYYKPSHSRNMRYVGLSSGKLLEYLMSGLIIAVNDLPYWNRAVKDYALGVTYDENDVSGLLNALELRLGDDEASIRCSAFLEKTFAQAVQGLAELVTTISASKELS